MDNQQIEPNQTQITPSKNMALENCIGMILAGLGLGWIIGMANSPVIKDIIMAFVAVITTVMGLMSGYGGTADVKNGIANFFMGTHKTSESSDVKDSISPKIVRILPLGLFLAFLAVGAGAGVYTKNSNILLPDYKKMATELGIPDSVFNKTYNRQIFENRIGAKVDSLTVIDSLHIYQSFELMYGKAISENTNLIKAIQIAKKKQKEKLSSGRGNTFGPQTGLNSGKITINECIEADNLPSDMLKNWLLKKVKATDKSRIKEIESSDEPKLKAELKKLCPSLK